MIATFKKHFKIGKFDNGIETASILDIGNGKYGIAYPVGYLCENRDYEFKTLNGAIRRLERQGWERVS